MTLEVAALRGQFPSLSSGTAHFDGPGGSQTPEPVARAMHDVLVSSIANRGSVTAAERTAEGVVREARAAVGDLLGTDPQGVVFGRSMTALTFDVARTLAAGWGPGDEVAVSRLDHDANVRPWVIAAERAGATVRFVDFDPATSELTAEHVAAAVGDRTRLVALTGASNLVGTRPDLPGIAELVHDHGALFFVDGVHLTAHSGIDVASTGADFFACSPYKFFGPHCGVVAARPDLLEQLHPDKLLPSSDAVPERFELGTLPYELLAGTTACVDFIAGLAAPGGSRRERVLAAMAATAAHEDALRRRIENALAALPGLTVHSRARHRTPTLLLTFADRPAVEAYRHLATLGVNVPAGSFYAIETSRHLGLGDTGGLRIGVSAYNDEADVDRLLTGLTAFARG